MASKVGPHRKLKFKYLPTEERKGLKIHMEQIPHIKS
jgi:hypothetical protein